MAFVHIEHSSEMVKVNLPLNMILPDPAEIKVTPLHDRKVLYLLHGLSDDASAWQRYTAIEVYARRFGIVVVMPTAGRSFYLDQPNGQRYFTYLVEELTGYLEAVFGIQPRRENTLIAGLSMGGYGAMKAALLRPERYFAAASFSGVLSLAILDAQPDHPNHREFETLFGDLAKLTGSEHDPFVWLKRASQQPEILPRLYASCGLQDDIYPLTVLFRDACRKLGVPLEYVEADGRHEWSLWDQQIQQFLAFALDPLA